MSTAWIQLECPSCGEDWEADPTDLPDPRAKFTCRSCSSERQMAEFIKTARGLEILREFH